MSYFFIKLGRVVARVVPVLVVAWYGHQAFSVGVLGHQDEPAWVASGYYFELLRRGELSHPDWWLLPARESPPMGKYIFGAAFALFGKPIRSIEPLAAWHEGWYLRFGLDPTAGESGELRGALSKRLDKRRRALQIGRRYPPIPDRDYIAGRYTALGFGMIAAAAVASLGRCCRSELTGLAAGLAFALHPLVIEAYTHALFDIIALAFSALAVRALVGVMGPVWSGATAAPGITIVRGLWVGLALSMAVGTKMNALIVVLVAGALLFVPAGRAIWGSTRGVVAAGVGLVIALGFGFAVFVAINPTLYPDPSRGLRELFTIPAMTTRWQASFLPNFLDTPRAKLTTVGNLIGARPWALAPLIAVTLGPTWLGFRRLSARTVLVVWWWLALVAVVVWIPFPWERYALPILPPAAVLVADAAMGLLALVAGLWKWVGSRN